MMRRTPIVLPNGLSIYCKTVYAEISDSEYYKMRDLFDVRMDSDRFLRKAIKYTVAAFLMVSLVAYFSLTVGEFYLKICSAILLIFLTFLLEYAVAAHRHNSFKKHLAYRDKK